MCVCSDENWPYDTRTPGSLTIKTSTGCTIDHPWSLLPTPGKSERLPRGTQLNGAIYVSAKVLSGWNSPKKNSPDDLATIQHSNEQTGGHAFAIVGYTSTGFIVQNCWGTRWGTKSTAVWTYEDWTENVSDGWVLRLAVSTPKVFGLTTQA